MAIDRFDKLNETHAKQIEENPEIMTDDLETFEENQYHGDGRGVCFGLLTPCHECNMHNIKFEDVM